MTSTGAIRTIDMRLIDDLFRMGDGYVLDFTDRTFASFFQEELSIDINNDKYKAEGTSKAKRLRYFLKICSPPVRIKLLKALWEYREASRRRNPDQYHTQDAEDEFWKLIVRLGGNRPSTKPPAPPAQVTTAINPTLSHALRDRLLKISALSAQTRGYEFERFLKELFDANGLAARAPFRVVGEQIDGSFELAGDTYLLEAKWQGPLIGVEALHAFHGKIEQKANWARGLYVSYSGFSPDGLAAFGGGKRLICMDGLDLHEMLDRGLSFSDVMKMKARRAAESGNPFIQVRELFLRP